MAAPFAEEEARRIWTNVTEKARRELPSSSFAMWFADVRPGTVTADVIEVLAPSDYARDWLSKRYLHLIRSAAAEAAGRPLRVEVVVDPATGAEPLADPPPEPVSAAPETHTSARARVGGTDERLPFPDRYTFESFVPGPSNRFAHAAAMAVAEAPPSKAYNPLFVYGGVGLGKTHLLFAIGHHMQQLTPRLRVKYVTSETFLTEFIKAVRERQAGYQFQRRYRDVDVLLMDDIQFLARREETQTEFFHTFNALHASERQIVIASDRPPQELSGMEERLINRFRWGLCVDVQPPDLETRIAILQLKAQRDGIAVPDDVLDFIASKFDQNIRELEGALLRVAAFSSLTGQGISLQLTERALEGLLPQAETEIPPQLILDETATYFGLRPEDLISKSRSRPLTTARHIAMYLMRECTGMSLIKIGEAFHRDHSTALHGIRKVEEQLGSRGMMFRQVQDLTRSIRGRARAT
jgi:chromosomal replication initiator protein